MGSICAAAEVFITVFDKLLQEIGFLSFILIPNPGTVENTSDPPNPLIYLGKVNKLAISFSSLGNY